jgi:NitT/TauT family transport system substrate-binding protein
MTNRQRLCSWLLIFAAVIALCESPAGAPAGKPEKANINFGIFPLTNYGVVYLAIQEGFFAEQGLTVTPRLMGSTSPTAALLGGDYDIAGITWPAFLIAFNRGITLVPVSEADRGGPGNANFVVKADSQIRTPADLIGKKVGVVTVGGVCDFLLNDALRNQDLDYKAVRYTPINVPDMAPTMLRDGIDAACIPEPVLTGVREQGFRSILDLFVGPYNDWPLVGFQVTDAFAQKNPNTVAALRRSFEKALKFTHDNPAKLRQIYTTFTPLKLEQASKITLSNTPDKSDFTQVKRVADVMDRLNVLPQKLKLPPSVQGR